MRLLAISLLAGLPLLAASSADLVRARKLYNYTDYDASLKVLQALPDKDGAAYELIGRNHFMQGDYKKATDSLEKALAADPNNSDYALWLGRAYGRRAETSTPFTALVNAGKARQNFEKAVRLDPRNLEALSDLFEYYLDAPGFVGGGLDKAAKTAAQMSELDPVEGHWAMARLAEKKKEFGTAEEHFRLAAQMAPQEVGKVLEMAKFLAKQGRYQESEQHFQRAEKLAPNNPRVMFARADTYVQSGRNLETARQLLKRYLESQLTPDDPPRTEAERLLKKASGG